MPRISRRTLLVTGIPAGLLSPMVVSLQAWLREGFDLAVHPLSLLSLGEHGWIQITNFIFSGLLFLAFATGMQRTLKDGPGRKWGPRLFGFYGIILIAAGVFTVDPMLGFPPGAPKGVPAALSWHAQLHNFTFIFAFIALIIGQFIFARRFSSLHQTGPALLSLATGVATPVLIVLSQILPAVSGYILFGMGLMINLWIVHLAKHLLGQLPDKTTSSSDFLS